MLIGLKDKVMTSEIEQLLEQLLKSLGIAYFPTIIVAVLIIWAIRNPEKIERWASLLYGLGSHFSAYCAKKSIQSQIQSIVNLAARELNSLIDGIALSKVKIKWIKEASPQAFIEGGEVVIIVGYEENLDKVLLNAILAYLQKGVLTEGSIYLSDDVREGLRFVLAERILLTQGKISVFEELQKQVSEKDERVKRIVDKLRAINAAGLLIPVYLNELQYLAKQLYPFPPNESVLRETLEWLDFVYSLAVKHKDEDLNPKFIRSFIKSDVVLIGRSEKVASMRDVPYLTAILYSFITLGAKRIYVLARGHRNIRIAKKILKKLPFPHKCVFRTEETLTLDSKKVRLLCYVVE